MQDFILRVRMDIQRDPFSVNFIYKLYEKDYPTSLSPPKDLLIACLKRTEKDTLLTDVQNRLVIPTHLTYDFLVVWGMQVTQARNFAVEYALKHNFSHLLFVDDDILAPNNALLKLWKLMYEDELPTSVLQYTNNGRPLVVAANYYRKVEPLISAHVYDKLDDSFGVATKVCALGFTLINLKEIAKKVPAPLFWEFGAPDGYWSMGEDAFFTKNLIEYTNSYPIVDLTTECLHYDKQWKRMYGRRDPFLVYASGQIEDFETIRVPPRYPLILVGIPTRDQSDPIAVDLSRLELLRGYRTEVCRVNGYMVDEARNILATEALKRGAEYLLFIDNDVVPPVDGLNKLIETIEEDDNIGMVVGDYSTKGYDNHSVHLSLDPKGGYVVEVDRLRHEVKDKLECRWLAGLGFALVRTSVFKQIRPPYFKCVYKLEWNERDVNEDAYFCELLFESGYRIIIRMDVQCLHLKFESGEMFKTSLLSDEVMRSTLWATSLDLFRFKLRERPI